jgi:hypothetical protein
MAFTHTKKVKILSFIKARIRIRIRPKRPGSGFDRIRIRPDPDPQHCRLHQNDAAPAPQCWMKESTKLAKKSGVCAVKMNLKILMSDSGLSDIGIIFFIVGLIRYRTRGLQSDKFLSDIGLGFIGVGYRISATKIFDVAPTYAF